MKYIPWFKKVNVDLEYPYVLYDHVDVYVDESGDLGFSNPRSSKYLVVCAMASADSRILARLVKKANRKFGMKEKGAIEFKFNKSDDRVKRYFLEGVSRTDSWIVWGAVIKTNTKKQHLRDKSKLYHEICGRVLAEIFRQTHSRKIHVILDRRTGKRTNKASLNNHITNILEGNHAGHFPPELEISHFDALNCEALQVHDFVVGSVFQELERGDHSYCDIIRDRILHGTEYW